MAANTTAFIKNIIPNSSSAGENGSVHETNPTWVLTFLRWKVRDTLRTEPTTAANYKTIPKNALVVENDCIQLSVADSKTVLTPSMTATLLITDVNYETELAPGDFVFVNILNWEADARKVADRARAGKAINGVHDGFKGFFKVQSVRKTLSVEPNTGVKTYAIKITAFAFTEFNNSIYFNPYLLSATDTTNLQLYVANIGLDWAKMQQDKGLTQIQRIIQYLICSFVGSGFTDVGRTTDSIAPVSPNTHFYMPPGVGALLGLSNLESAKDAYNYLFGIQKYSNQQGQTLAAGMNPSNIVAPDPTKPTNSNRFIFLDKPVEGNTVTKPEYWNQQKAWSILNQFTNSPLNELFTCFRIAPNGSVMPTMVFRQIPFTTDGFSSGSYTVTKFMNVPRWNISPALAFSFDLGRDDALRMNYVQYYGKSVNGPSNLDINEETAQRNYLYDADDVQRNGLRPYVVNTEFDRIPDPPSEAITFRSPGWAKILGDALIGGHLKMTGTINFVGIPEPIAVGDNLQFDGVVYHIEEISHNAAINPQNGKKMFRTTISVTHGVSLQSGNNVAYNEMTYGSGYDERTADHSDANILPGVSESQDIVSRPTNPDSPVSPGESYIQPNTNTSISKSTRDS